MCLALLCFFCRRHSHHSAPPCATELSRKVCQTLAGQRTSGHIQECFAFRGLPEKHSGKASASNVHSCSHSFSPLLLWKGREITQNTQVITGFLLVCAFPEQSSQWVLRVGACRCSRQECEDLCPTSGRDSVVMRREALRTKQCRAESVRKLLLRNTEGQALKPGCVQARKLPTDGRTEAGSQVPVTLGPSWC